MELKTTSGNTSWNSDTVYALGLYKFITSIVGIWPPTDRDVFAKILLSIFTFLQISMMLSLIAETNTECSSLNGIAEIISLIGCCVISLLKVFTLRGFHSKLFDIITSSIEDWSNTKSSRSRSIMRKYAKLGRNVCIFQMTSGYITTVPMIIGALPFLAPQINVNGTSDNATAAAKLRGLPLPTPCIFGDINDISYVIVFVIQSLQLLITCTANVGIDVYFFGVTMHLCGQFKLLGNDLEDFPIDVGDDNKRDLLVRLIQRHVRLSQLAQFLEDSFNAVILVQVSANALQICLMGIQLLLNLKSGNTVVIVNTIIILYVMNLQLFLYSYAGDRLSSEIANLRESAYFLPWYKMPSTLARDVLFIIMRNHKNFNITAGKVYRMDIDNFKNLIKALGSYFSVLRIMFDA